MNTSSPTKSPVQFSFFKTQNHVWMVYMRTKRKFKYIHVVVHTCMYIGSKWEEHTQFLTFDEEPYIPYLKHSYCIEDIQWFDVEYGIYFTSDTGYFLYFHECFALVKIFKISCLMSEMNLNSYSTSKSINFLFISFSSFFEHVLFKY